MAKEGCSLVSNITYFLSSVISSNPCGHQKLTTVKQVYHLRRSERQRIAVFPFQSRDDGGAEEKKGNGQLSSIRGIISKLFNRFPNDV